MIEDEETLRGWISGLFDAEGCASMSSGINAKTGKKWTNRRLTLGMADLDAIDTLSEGLERLGVKHFRSETGGSAGKVRMYHVWITGQAGIRRFSELMTLSCHNKNKRMAQILDSFTQKGICAKCGVLWAEMTEGCDSCRTRLGYRERQGSGGRAT